MRTETTSYCISEKGICQVERTYGEGKNIEWCGDVCAFRVKSKN